MELHDPQHRHLYRHARDYDIAFSFRDFEQEFDFLQTCAQRFGGRAPTRFLEVAAGPGVHAVVAAQRGLASIALDLSPPMMDLCAEKAAQAGVTVRTLVADMARFDLQAVGEGAVDLAFNPLTSITYLRTLDDLRAHFVAMQRALTPGGVYVIEHNHPRDFFWREHFSPSTWTQTAQVVDERGPRHITVVATWVAEPPTIRATEQTYETVSQLHVTERAGDATGTILRQETITDRGWLRLTTPAELSLCAQLAGLEVCALYGGLDPQVPFDDSDESWRTVLVCRRPA